MSTPNFEQFDIKQFAKEIRAFMKKHGLSVRDWADLTESSPSTVRRFERGDRVTTVDLVAKYQKVMRTYKPNGASQKANNPGSRASRRGKR